MALRFLFPFGRRLVALRLDSARNQLLQMDVVLSVVTMAAGLGAVVTGIFGMNLRSGWEVSADAFAVTSAVVGGAIALFTVALYFFVRRRGLLVS